MNPIWAGLGFMALITAVAFTLGFLIGRFSERRSISAWLWDRPSYEKPAGWEWAEAIDHRAHRRKDPEFEV